MYRIFQVLLVFVISIGIYYAFDYYETKQFVENVYEMELIKSDTLNKLSITKYPEQATYLTFDKSEVQEAYRILNKPDLQKTERLQTSENYIKIRFQEDGSQSSIQYYFYDNGYITRVEDAISVSTYQYYKTDAAELNAIIEELLTGKSFD
ncbi:hypothetical protein LZ480_06585 [Solibacillus sp. MA9]|uniref:Uncharacterized protein n=1 Tax=Solibacillus palustris TaxID=2908203 RepID=A0ABS9UB29_9BACL|nr:hypothetical protein [Solibacillus sp. MA9]MCH7321557.1 hypothetical protein [Solibacillus sp. MA9]